MEIDCHVEEQIFVETNAVRKCKEWMNKKDVFVIIGNKGSGKSRNGLEILRQFGETEEDFDLLKVTNIQQVKDIIMDERKTAVLIDDGFLSKEYSNKNSNNCNMLDLLNARNGKGNMKIIFTVDSSKMNVFKQLLHSHRLFKNCCQIHLSSSRFCMSEDEKANLLFKLCKKHDIGITWNSYERRKDFYLDGREVYEIAKTDPFIGYPKLCFMFTSNKRFLQLGINFFKHPDQTLMDEINSLRDSTDINPELIISYALLVYTLLNTGYLEINKIDLSKLEAIMDSFCNSQRKPFFNNKVKEIAEQMDGLFLKQDSQTLVYHFKHPMIYEALAISYIDFNPSEVISVLNFDFMIKSLKLEFEDWGQQGTSLIIAKEMFGYLTKRLFTIFEKDYKMRSAEFMKTLCGSSIILQNNPDFIGFIIKEFNKCTSQNTIDIQIYGKRVQMPFNFPRALLWFLIQKHKVDLKPISTVLHFIENDMKDEQNMEKVKASKKVVVACFYYLCETDNSDMKLELIYRLIHEYGIECNYDYSIQVALKNGNDTAVSFLLSYASKEIDIVKLVLEVEHVEDSRRLWDLISTNLSIECNDTDNKTDILNILIRSFPENFNLTESINTACRKLCKDLVTGILSNDRNFTFDTDNIVNTACENGWEDVLKILLNKKLCNQSEKKHIFTSSCKDGIETFLKWMLLTVDSHDLDVEEYVLHEFRCENFETVKNFIMKLRHCKEMETMVKNLVTHFNLPIVSFIRWVINDADNQIHTGNTNELQSVYILQWIYDRFPNLQTDVKNTVHETINNTCNHSDEILQWLNENTKVMVHPISTLLELACKNDLQKIVKWILQTFDQNTFNMHGMVAYKIGYHDILAGSIINNDQYAINKSEVLAAAVINDSINVMNYLLNNTDHTLLDIETAVHIACRRGKFDIVKMLLSIVEYKAFDVKAAIDKVFDGITFVTINTLSDGDSIVDINIDKASKCERIKIVKLMLEIFDHKSFHMTTIIHTAFEQRWFDLIKWTIEKVDDSLLDLNEIASMASQVECVDIVILIAGKIRNSVNKGALDKLHGYFNIVRHLIACTNISLTYFRGSNE